MDLCIKTGSVSIPFVRKYSCFNPCFNGSMYKNAFDIFYRSFHTSCFNPCFNGSMYKNFISFCFNSRNMRFNPCFNGSMYKNPPICHLFAPLIKCFNPCFNGSMYKNFSKAEDAFSTEPVSILVLMDLCIKTLILL